MMSVSFPVVALPQKTLRLCRYVHTKQLYFFNYLSCLLHSQVYKSSILSLNLFLFSFWLDTNFEVSGPFCAQHGICGQREISAGEGPGRRRGRRRRMINKFQKKGLRRWQSITFSCKKKTRLSSRIRESGRAEMEIPFFFSVCVFVSNMYPEIAVGG